MPESAKPNTLTKTLGGGSAAALAAAALFTLIASEESGRTVKATPAPDGTIAVEHVTGRQYLTAYRDSVGVLTICDGLTRGVRAGEVRTEAQCARELEAELTATAARVMACTPNLAGHPNQQVAAVSLAYNIGTGRAARPGVKGSGYCGSSAARHFAAGRWRQGCDAILSWNKGGRPLRVIKGLDSRRKRERAICLRGL